MTVERNEGARREYVARILKVEDHIERHLDDELTLERLAGIACFSPFHFHRIWTSLTGEGLAAFIQRLRLARAADKLLKDPRAAVLEIALDCGFSGAAVFARAFRERYGMSASAWRVWCWNGEIIPLDRYCTRVMPNHLAKLGGIVVV